MDNIKPLRNLWGAHLFVPANRAGFLTKLPVIRVRNLIIDLEYATRVKSKTDGRHLCQYAIGYLRSVRPDFNITVRTNLTKTGGLFEDDLRVVLETRPDALRIPSVNTPDEIERTDELVTKLEAQYGLPEGGVRLHPMIETPTGLRNGVAIARASRRNEALCLGGEDWAHNCGLTRTRAGKELEYVKAALVAIAAEESLFPIDSVYNWLDDPDGLVADTENSKLLGFHSRATINPRQVDTLNLIYRPAETDRRWAKTLLDGLTQMDICGTPQLVAGGVITDPLAVHQARTILSYRED